MGRVVLNVTKKTDEQISTAISLADKWGFDCVRQSGIEALERLYLEPVRMLQLARIHGINQWVKPELRKLAEDDKRFTQEEAECLGLEFITILLNLRTQALNTSLCSTHGEDDSCLKHGGSRFWPNKFGRTVEKLLDQLVNERWPV